ncbi:MAG: DotA/TraY family protein [Luteimonas sp.]
MRAHGLPFSFLLTVLLAPLTGFAQQQEPGRFFRPPPDDPSLGVLREIFGNLVDYVAGNATAAEMVNNDTVIGAGFAVFCTAVVTLGLLFVAYTTITGIINTAHDGEFLGRKMSSVWIPIRMAVGSALLLPIAGGFCLLQILVMWMAVQGIGAASVGWNAMLAQVDQGGMVGHPNIPDARPMVANIFRSELCMAAMNKAYAESERSQRVNLVKIPRTMSVMVPTDDTANVNGLGGLFGISYKPVQLKTTSYSWETSDGYTRNDVCGTLEWEESAASEAGNSRYINLTSVYAAHGQAVEEIILQMRPVAQAIVNGEKPSSVAISEAAYRYENRLRDLSRGAINSIGTASNDGFIQYAQRGGFITAGTYYNHIISLQDAVQLAVNSFPTSKSIDIDQKETHATLAGYRDAMAVADEYLLKRAESGQQGYEAERGGWGACTPIPTTWEAVRKCMSEPALYAISKITENLAGANTSHVAQVKSIGDMIMNAAWVIAGANALTNGVAGSVGGEMVSQGGTAGFFSVSSFLEQLTFLISFLVISLLAAGAMMSFYIPMIPFIAWITGVIKWVISVVEAMIAAPIWGAAHIHPDGDDAVGRAGPGYFILLSMIMRPLLMLFGLICSIAVANPIAHLVNGGYMMAVSGAMHDSANGLGALVAYSVIYVVIMTTVLHAVFSLINWVPDTVMRWMGSAVGMHGVADSEDREARSVFGVAAGRASGVAGHGGGKRSSVGGDSGKGGSGGQGGGGSGGTTKEEHHALRGA